jgi:hypothetical protein
MGMMGVFLWTIGSVQTEEGGKKMTNHCHICGRMKPMTEATICDSCKDAMKRNGYIKVLRCKDCKHGSLYCTEDVCGATLIECNHPDLGETVSIHKWDWFCADGERRTEDA